MKKKSFEHCFCVLFSFSCKYNNNHFEVIKYFSVEKRGVFFVYILDLHSIGDRLRECEDGTSPGNIRKLMRNK